MRLSVVILLLTAGTLLLSACHKSAGTANSEATATNNSLIGDWRMIQLNGGPYIDVVPLTDTTVFIMKIHPDSTVQNYYNGRLTYTTTWSLKKPATPANPDNIIGFASTISSRDTTLLYTARLTHDGQIDKLVIRMYPDEGYQATYARIKE